MPQSLRELIATIRTSNDHHLYSSLAPMYKFIYDRHFDYDEQLSIVREEVPEDAMAILEGGCGAGQLLALLDAEYEHVVGVDLNPEMAMVAREVVGRTCSSPT